MIMMIVDGGARAVCKDGDQGKGGARVAGGGGMEGGRGGFSSFVVLFFLHLPPRSRRRLRGWPASRGAPVEGEVAGVG